MPATREPRLVALSVAVAIRSVAWSGSRRRAPPCQFIEAFSRHLAARLPFRGGLP